MEVIINESGCKQLSHDMLEKMKKLAGLISAIEDKDGTLKAALGDDYENIAKRIKYMASQLEAARSEFNGIINDMNDYMERVQNVHITLG